MRLYPSGAVFFFYFPQVAKCDMYPYPSASSALTPAVQDKTSPEGRTILSLPPGSFLKLTNLVSTGILLPDFIRTNIIRFPHFLHCPMLPGISNLLSMLQVPSGFSRKSVRIHSTTPITPSQGPSWGLLGLLISIIRLFMITSSHTVSCRLSNYVCQLLPDAPSLSTA